MHILPEQSLVYYIPAMARFEVIGRKSAAKTGEQDLRFSGLINDHEVYNSNGCRETYYIAI